MVEYARWPRCAVPVAKMPAMSNVMNRAAKMNLRNDLFQALAIKIMRPGQHDARHDRLLGCLHFEQRKPTGPKKEKARPLWICMLAGPSRRALRDATQSGNVRNRW